MNAIPMIVGGLDMKGDITFVNEYGSKLLGYPRWLLVGRHWYNFMPDVYKKSTPDFSNFSEETYVPYVEYSIPTRHGEWLDIAWRNLLLREDDGTIIGLISMGEDITARKQADVAKTKLLSQSAHQLRTPLSNVRWSLEVLMDEIGKLSDGAQECLRNANDEVIRMVDTINTLLMASRIEAQSLHADVTVIFMRDFLTEIAERHRAVYGKPDQKFAIHCNETLACNADVSILREIMSAILSNAIKYTPEDGSITITADGDGKTTRISVADSGIGIPKDEQSKIFSKVYRGRNALAMKQEGTGLGLYLAHSLTEILGGKISLTSKEGKGTTITLELPQDIHGEHGAYAPGKKS